MYTSNFNCNDLFFKRDVKILNTCSENNVIFIYCIFILVKTKCSSLPVTSLLIVNSDDESEETVVGFFVFLLLLPLKHKQRH